MSENVKNAERTKKSYPLFEIKANEETGIVEAIANVFGIVDDGKDIVHKGAFTKTISERAGRIRVLDNHRYDSTEDTIGKLLEVREVGRDGLPLEVQMAYPEATGGLYTMTQFWLDDPKSLAIFKRIKEGAINELSIGFDIITQDFGKVKKEGTDTVVRNIREIRLWEYSFVLWGMNPATAVSGVKDMEGGKEYTPDGPVKRCGDYVKSMTHYTYSDCINLLYFDGMCSEAEYRALLDGGIQILDVISASMSEDMALREMAKPMDFFMWGLDRAVEQVKHSTKAGRVLSQANIDKILGAVEKLQEVLQTAGLYDKVENEADQDAKTGAGPEIPPTQALNVDLALKQIELLELELE